MSDKDKEPMPRFVTEGFFLAMPPSFPGVAVPQPLDSSRLVRLAGPDCDGMVFAAGAGPDPRVFQFMPMAPFGYAASWSERGEEVLGIGCLEIASRGYVVLLISCSGCVKLILRKSIAASEGIQEWTVVVPSKKHEFDLGHGTIGSMIVEEHQQMVYVAAGKRIWSLRVDAEEGFRVEKVERYDGDGVLFRLTPTSIVLAYFAVGQISILEEGRPSSSCQVPELTGAHSVVGCDGCLLWANPDGVIFSWRPEDSKSTRHGTVGLAPVTALTRLPDGRIYCFAGKGISHWFRLDPDSERTMDLGVAASVLTERRYGFEFSEIVRGVNGELYCAEMDRGGHLWIYFPPSSKVD